MNKNKNLRRVFRIPQSDKRALLLAEETLKMIIALIAITFLIYFLTALYFNSVNSQKFVHAQASLERISDVIRNVDIINEIVDVTPPGWHLFGFVDEEKPNLCSGKSCLCICDNVFLGLGDQAEKCSEDGVCEIVENLKDFEDIEITRPSISIDVIKQDGKIIITKNEP